MQALTAAFTRRIRTATGVSGTTAVGLPWIRPQLRPRQRPTHKVRKRARKALLTISARLQVGIPVPTARTAAGATSVALAKAHPHSHPRDRGVPQTLWANFKTMQARASVATSSNETIIAAEAWARLTPPVGAQTVAVRELASIKSRSIPVRLPRLPSRQPAGCRNVAYERSMVSQRSPGCRPSDREGHLRERPRRLLWLLDQLPQEPAVFVGLSCGN